MASHVAGEAVQLCSRLGEPRQRSTSPIFSFPEIEAPPLALPPPFPPVCYNGTRRHFRASFAIVAPRQGANGNKQRACGTSWEVDRKRGVPVTTVRPGHESLEGKARVGGKGETGPLQTRPHHSRTSWPLSSPVRVKARSSIGSQLIKTGEICFVRFVCPLFRAKDGPRGLRTSVARRNSRVLLPSLYL